MTVTPRSVVSPREKDASPERASYEPREYVFTRLVLPTKKDIHERVPDKRASASAACPRLGRRRQRTMDKRQEATFKHAVLGAGGPSSLAEDHTEDYEEDVDPRHGSIEEDVDQEEGAQQLPPPNTAAGPCTIYGDTHKLRHGKHVRVEVNGQWVGAKVLAATSLFVTLKFDADGSIATVPLDGAPKADKADPAPEATRQESWVQLAMAETPTGDNCSSSAEEATSPRVEVPASTEHVRDWDKNKMYRNIAWVRKRLPRFNAKKFHSNIKYVQKLLQSYGAKFEENGIYAQDTRDTQESKELFGDRHQFAFCVRSPQSPSFSEPSSTPRSPSTAQDAY